MHILQLRLNLQVNSFPNQANLSQPTILDKIVEKILVLDLLQLQL